MSLESLVNDCEVPGPNSRVYKDECVYSFDSPESENGLYICLKTFHGVGQEQLDRYFAKFGHRLYLQHRRIRRWKEVAQSTEDQPAAKRPTKLAIGVQDGFAAGESRYSFEEVNSLLVLPERTSLQLPCQELPDKIQRSVAGVLAAESAHKLEELALMANTWEGDVLQESRHAGSLRQLDNGVRVPPSGWQCASCGLRENLWLNLTDGSVLCGRRYFDGTGGNNHAVEHYQATGYPLAVKLGTITPEGADVYSYAEDTMVLDSKLAEHLKHFGIELQSMRKTEKTMNELEIDANLREWDIIQESGRALAPAYGPGLTGMRNLGNSCYMNSVLQALFRLPSFVRRYYEGRPGVLDAVAGDPVGSLSVQLSKIADGLLSGRYSAEPPEPRVGDVAPQFGIRPQMFKLLVGRGHQEFSSSRQQDAHEFLLHLLSLVERDSVGAEDAGRVLAFDVEERIRCCSSGQVAYKRHRELALSFPIPLDSAADSKQAPRVSLKACLDALAAPEVVEDFQSPATGAKGLAERRVRVVTFPSFLVLHARKFTVDANWCPRKLDVELDVPELLDLEFLRARGRQPDEVEMHFPQERRESSSRPRADPALVAQVRELGFSENGAVRSVAATAGQGVEAAINWAMDHSQDADFDQPLPEAAADDDDNGAEFVPNEDGVAMIVSMGFTRPQAVRALRSTQNSVERAADWIFSHMEELDAPDTAPDAGAGQQQQQQQQQQQPLTDGQPKYRLLGFISHMGASAHSGHYVCHLRRGQRWYIFNDERVNVSEDPPKHMAYLYFYERV